jgi:drug/metabolite transporter (DMT)-like permease
LIDPNVIIVIAFAGSFFLGITPTILALGVSNQNVIYGLIARAFAAIPLVLLLSLVFDGKSYFYNYINVLLMILVILAVSTLIGADYLIMNILQRKPVGQVAPLIATFPLFTSMFLILSGIVQFSPIILIFTGLIVVGVGLITFQLADVPKSNEAVSEVQVNTIQTVIVRPHQMFDREVLLFGAGIAILLGLTNFLDVVVLRSYEHLNGINYTSMKFTSLILLSILLYIITGNKVSDFKIAFAKRRSTAFLLLAGICAWGFGSILVYTSYKLGNPAVVNAIIGVSPVFAVVSSYILRLENMNLQKIFGLLCCVVASIGIVTLR